MASLSTVSPCNFINRSDKPWPQPAPDTQWSHRYVSWQLNVHFCSTTPYIRKHLTTTLATLKHQSKRVEFVADMQTILTSSSHQKLVREFCQSFIQFTHIPFFGFLHDENQDSQEIIGWNSLMSSCQKASQWTSAFQSWPLQLEDLMMAF